MGGGDRKQKFLAVLKKRHALICRFRQMQYCTTKLS